MRTSTTSMRCCRRSNVVTRARAEHLAASLGLDVEALPICLACLSFVSLACHRDDGGAAARRWARKMAPHLWEDGLEEPALLALRRALMAGVRDAEQALADAQAGGGRSGIAQAVVFHLGTQLAEHERASMARWARDRPSLEIVEGAPE